MLRAAHVRWLREELPRLVAAGVLTDDSAGRLRDHYRDADDGAGARVVVVLFGVLAAVLIGGGVILLIAHNWAELSRPVRTALSIAPLAASLTLAAWVLATERGPAWREGVAALWGLSIGAAISLVAQTYHLPGDWPTLLLTWLLLGAPVVYLLRSVAAALLYCLGTVSWVLEASFETPDATWFLPLLALVAPFTVLRLRRRPDDAGAVLLAWALALTVAIGLVPSFDALADRWWEGILTSGFVAIRSAGELAAVRRWGRAFRVVGTTGYLGTMLVLSHTGVWDDRHSSTVVASAGAMAAEWVAVALVVAAAAFLALAAAQRGGIEDWAVAAGLLVTWAACVHAAPQSPEWPAMLVNVYLLGLGVALLATGLRDASLGRANLGTALLGLLVLLRFFDTEWGFLVRGSAFIAVGLGFLLINVALLRRRRAG